ncbi:MAG: ankyrin repeat domain-containing protein [Saprospiraceae bacterium]|nr:ankyrin repeat domain-containing protein [Saprospiraceae bacterium]
MNDASKLFEEFKTLLQERNEEQIIEFLTSNPTVLVNSDEDGPSGLMLIAYHRLANVMPVAQQLAPSVGLYESIAYGLLQKVKDTISTDSSLLNRAAPDGFSPLCLAAYFAQYEVASWLSEQGADLNQAATNPSQVAPIHAAVAAKHLGLVQLLLSKGADVNLTQAQGVSPLHSAAHRGNLQIVKALVEAGADIHAQMDSGETAVSFAEKEGHQQVIDYLNCQV